MCLATPEAFQDECRCATSRLVVLFFPPLCSLKQCDICRFRFPPFCVKAASDHSNLFTSCDSLPGWGSAVSDNPQGGLNRTIWGPKSSIHSHLRSLIVFQTSPRLCLLWIQSMVTFFFWLEIALFAWNVKSSWQLRGSYRENPRLKQQLINENATGWILTVGRLVTFFRVLWFLGINEAPELNLAFTLLLCLGWMPFTVVGRSPSFSEIMQIKTLNVWQQQLSDAVYCAWRVDSYLIGVDQICSCTHCNWSCPTHYRLNREKDTLLYWRPSIKWSIFYFCQCFFAA